MEIKSKYCITPNNCIDIRTEIPVWLSLVIVGTTIMLIERILFK